jgi:glycosyltransferase involved in cell wall biosynthesis
MVVTGQRVWVSVIATILNEGEELHAWLRGLDAQTRRPDEIIVIDGGSADGTWERLQAEALRGTLRCEQLPGANISQGRNRAIEVATGEIIAVTDAGTVARPDWLELLLMPFEDATVDVAAGFFVPRTRSRWERALAAATLPDLLDYCEDVVWDLAMRRAGARQVLAGQAVVEFHVRPNVRAFALQYVRYARGDGKAGLFARRHLIRYATYAGLMLVLLMRRRPVLLVSTGVAGIAYIRRSLLRLWNRDRKSHRPAVDTLVVVPLVVWLKLVGDLAKMIGYPTGLWWRYRRFSSISWRTSWRRISPDGRLRARASSTTGARQPTSSPGA